MREQDQQRDVREPVHEEVEQLERAWVGPVRILEQQHRGLGAGTKLGEIHQRAHRLFLAPPG